MSFKHVKIVDMAVNLKKYFLSAKVLLQVYRASKRDRKNLKFSKSFAAKVQPYELQIHKTLANVQIRSLTRPRVLALLKDFSKINNGEILSQFLKRKRFHH